MEKPIQDRRIFDLHCDTLTECEKRKIGLISDEMPHFSLDRLPKSLRWCQCMAIFMPDDLRGAAAEAYFDQVYARYQREIQRHKALLTPLGHTDAVENALHATTFASILTVEGGSALAGKLENVEKLYRCGVRMMTLTWNGVNEIAGGAATQMGFTPFGRQVVAEMERLGMLVDVSHLSDRAFWELCSFAEKPFVASHSNARAVWAHRRNLTDEMFGEIVRRGGLVGINYFHAFLSGNGLAAPIQDVLQHIRHFLKLGGGQVLALGSDYDGADLPACLNGLDRIPNLIDALDHSDIPPSIVDNILFRNAQRLFDAHIPLSQR